MLKQMYCLADLLRLRGVWCGVLNGSIATVEEPFGESILGLGRCLAAIERLQDAEFLRVCAFRSSPNVAGRLGERLDGV